MRPNPALNGLRAIAILPVLALHAEPSKLPGGGLGVDLFFALSGYLITTSLLSEVAVSGSFSFRNFYARRVRRIWPALGLGVVLAVVLYAAQPVPPVGRGMTTAVLLTLTQFGNWFQSYGKADLGTLSHTWSLAVEEQYYLAWPLLLAVSIRRKWSPSRIATALLLLAVASAVARAVTFEIAGAGKAYFPTDCRLDGLALGSCLAVVSCYGIWPQARTFLASAPVAVSALLGVGVCMIKTSGATPSLYRGGWLLIALGATSVVAHLATANEGFLYHCLSFRPLVWVGTISYGLYVYDYPLQQTLSPLDLRRSVAGALAIAGTFALAVASSYLVERPILRRGAGPHQAISANPQHGSDAIAGRVDQ